MATRPFDQTSVEEKLIWYSLVLTYPFFFIGATYIVGCVVGWLVFMLMILRLYVEGRDSEAALPWMVVVWIFFMLVMLLPLWIAHADYQLGMGKTIKSTIGWAKGWALLALFPLLGAMVRIRPELLTRACCIVSAQSMLFIVLGLPLAVIGMDGQLFISPLKAVGGPGEDFFSVSFFGLNPETGRPRWRFFAPWAPAAGLLSCVYLIICWQEPNRLWRRLGIAGAVVMCLFCQSRAGWVIFFMLIPLLMFDRWLTNPFLLLTAIVVATAIVLLGEPLIESVLDGYRQIKESRPKSTEVRATLASIALQRWEAEAFWWGHGVVERGPKIVEMMPIGSHHSWYGLLFVKGLVGLFALALPLGLTICYLLLDAARARVVRSALLIIVVLICYSFFENLEILTYLYWPALLWLGMAMNPLKHRGILA